MRNKQETKINCIKCGHIIHYAALPGARCNHCIIMETIKKNREHEAQRLAGQIPPQGFSV